MTISTDTRVSDIATGHPATIRVFQRHQIDFCCGGKTPLSEVCAAHGLDVNSVVAELEAAVDPVGGVADWSSAPLSELVRHIQVRYHKHLRSELPRLEAMLAKVVSRHGDRLGDTLEPLQETFHALEAELLQHMYKEDQVLFPTIVALEDAGAPSSGGQVDLVRHAVQVMEADHADAGAALARIRKITRGFAPPEGACPTFRGLYYGLAELESDMHVHVHLENNVLFPRAIAVGAG